MKLEHRHDAFGNHIGYYFMCPACNEKHALGLSWQFNGVYEAPTFYPSVLVTGVKAINDKHGNWTGEYVRDEAGKPVKMRCHSYITDGRIAYLSDCYHQYAGQTLNLPDIEPAEPSK